MGSVKDLTVIKSACENSLGLGRFTFSDRYSVFDWGEMPDKITNKGAAIAILGAYFFEKLESLGIPTHYIGLVENGETKKLSQLNSISNTMEIKLLRVVKPKLVNGNYDYSEYKFQKNGFLIPLEIIYRNYLPPGSSVFRRLEKGEITPEDLGLDSMPVPNQKLQNPIVDFSTKLEITDRYIKPAEAKEISALSDAELDNLINLTLKINNLITDEFSKFGMINEDGKIEVGFDLERKIILVDVLGTLDECRFTYEGLPVSKEIARIFYRKTQWYQEVEEAKKKDRQNWKQICKLNPDPLPEKLASLISQVYCSCTNEITGREWFKDIPPLKNILTEIKGLI
ncbi:MAG: phosphoribosylaminoimidazolesuccinocarboxamide synthase [Ignavibacteria bacterium]|nr:phosphoribosylaminoimidazolesuccinocarboxamide synthase [Ignavibacteria bacterium]